MDGYGPTVAVDCAARTSGVVMIEREVARINLEPRTAVDKDRATLCRGIVVEIDIGLAAGHCVLDSDRAAVDKDRATLVRAVVFERGAAVDIESAAVNINRTALVRSVAVEHAPAATNLVDSDFNRAAVNIDCAALIACGALFKGRVYSGEPPVSIMQNATDRRLALSSLLV